MATKKPALAEMLEDILEDDIDRVIAMPKAHANSAPAAMGAFRDVVLK